MERITEDEVKSILIQKLYAKRLSEDEFLPNYLEMTVQLKYFQITEICCQCIGEWNARKQVKKSRDEWYQETVNVYIDCRGREHSHGGTDEDSEGKYVPRTISQKVVNRKGTVYYWEDQGLQGEVDGEEKCQRTIVRYPVKDEKFGEWIHSLPATESIDEGIPCQESIALSEHEINILKKDTLLDVKKRVDQITQESDSLRYIIGGFYDTYEIKNIVTWHPVYEASFTLYGTEYHAYLSAINTQLYWLNELPESHEQQHFRELWSQDEAQIKALNRECEQQCKAVQAECAMRTKPWYNEIHIAETNRDACLKQAEKENGYIKSQTTVKNIVSIFIIALTTIIELIAGITGLICLFAHNISGARKMFVRCLAVAAIAVVIILLFKRSYRKNIAMAEKMRSEQNQLWGKHDQKITPLRELIEKAEAETNQKIKALRNKYEVEEVELRQKLVAGREDPNRPSTAVLDVLQDTNLSFAEKKEKVLMILRDEERI